VFFTLQTLEIFVFCGGKR